MNTLADVFRGRAFEMTSLTAAINEIPYVPQRLGKLGLFNETGVATTTIFVEKKGMALSIIPTSPRGAPGTPISGDKRSLIPLKTQRLAASAELHADEVQDVRAFGSTDAMLGVTQKRDEKLAKMSLTLDLTLEYHRLGAVQGLLLDSDGSVIYDLFDQFGVSARADVNLPFTTAWTADDGGVLRKVFAGAARETKEDLGNVDPTGYLVLCGDDWFDAMVNHPEVRQTYLNQQAANALRESDPIDSVRYANMTFENYRGSGDVAIATNEARLIPLGVPELFQTAFGPADYMETANTIGLPKYVKAAPDPSGFDRFIAMEAQSNPICLCTRPRVLRKFTLS